MRFEKHVLDERQREYRNKIGHQCFLLLLYLILIDTALNGAGVQWLPYPANMMALLTVCAGIYQTRLILGGAYLPPGEKAGQRQRKTIIIAGFSVAVAAIAAVIVIRGGLVHTAVPAEDGDNSAMALFIISAVSLLMIMLSGLASRRQNRDRDGEE